MVIKSIFKWKGSQWAYHWDLILQTFTCRTWKVLSCHKQKFCYLNHYLRYIGIFCIFNDQIPTRFFKERLERDSVFKLTIFLDVSIARLPNGILQTGIYVKPTDTSVDTNFNSHTPSQYNRSVEKTLINRTIKHSAITELCHAELCRIQLVLAYNLCPQHMLENII